MSDIVRVYRNLHNGKLSVQYHYKGLGWRVAFHTDFIHLNDVTFKVSEASRQRTLRTKRKTVHAYIIGTMPDEVPYERCFTRVSYNPYKAPTFVIKDSGAPIHNAPMAVAYSDGSIFV